MSDVSEAVQRGYDALLAAGHTPEAIRAAVLADDLDMGYCDRCVIGHLYGLAGDESLDIGGARDRFDAAVVEIVGNVADHGAFWGFDIVGGIANFAEYRRLANEWRRLVTEKAEASS